ncbi:MAG: GtrA family protein [Elusimicrobiota bacterium]|jgi:putative flippase GtrA|nr:GtrA family protein [Elusimicrobiota bacterium]
MINYVANITRLDVKFIKFLFVGALNTAFGYACFVFFVALGFGEILAPLFSTVLGVLFNFKTTGVLVFNNKNNGLLPRFFAVYGIVYLCNVAGLKIALLCGLGNLYVAGLILILPLAFLAFYLNKEFVFGKVKK